MTKDTITGRNKITDIFVAIFITFAKGGWWLIKRIGKIAVAIVKALVKIFVAIISLSGSKTEVKAEDISDSAEPGELGMDVETGDLSRNGPGRKKVKL